MEKVQDSSKLDSMMKKKARRLVREGSKRGLHIRLLGAITFPRTIVQNTTT